MQDPRIAEAFPWPPSGPAPWLTTTDARRALHVTAQGVRDLVRRGQLAAERTLRGTYLFRQDDVLALAAERARAALALVRPRMLKAGRRPKQPALFSLYRRRGRFRPAVYALRSPSETAANQAGTRRRVR
jgi:helix-turn-helix protein